MTKKSLMKMRPLLATAKMMRMAASDKPKKKTIYYTERLVYRHGLYMRCHIQDGILKVAFFFAEIIRSGGRLPAYELFISSAGKQFITYDRLHDKWLTSKLDRLDWPAYIYTSEEKWISQSDDDALKKYLGSEKGGYEGLVHYQLQIREDELIKRHKKQTDPWDVDLAQVPSLPKDWLRWVDKVGIRQNYIFYQYSKSGIDTGYCTYCEKDVPIKNPRYDKRSRCSVCRHEITFKSVGKAGTIVTERNQMYLIQRCKDGFVIRQFEGYRLYKKGSYTTPECMMREIRRSIFDKYGMALRSYYWGMFKQRTTRWMPASICSPGYYGDDSGMVYGKTLPHLTKNELSRTGLPEMLRKNTKLDPEKYLAVLKEVPQLEKLAKANLPMLAHQCLSNHHRFQQNLHNTSSSSLVGMLGIDKHELKRLRQNNGGILFLEWLRHEKSIGKPIQDNDIIWFCKEQIVPNNIQFIQNKMSVVQVCNYLRRQMAINKKSSKEVLTTWADYMSMAKRLKMDTDDEIIFRVNKLFQRHDELVERCHEKDFAIQAGQILEDYPHVDEICESIKDKYEYADDEYAIIVPERIEDILHEGRNLHHCIANSDRYWERIERRETYVLFLRRTSDVNKSYYTLEVEPNGTIRQKRTMYDRQDPDIEDAKKFLTKWQGVISKRLSQDDLRLAKVSRTLRHQSYAQLRSEQKIIHTGELKGQLLVDVLLADLMESAA